MRWLLICISALALACVASTSNRQVTGKGQDGGQQPEAASDAGPAKNPLEDVPGSMDNSPGR